MSKLIRTLIIGNIKSISAYLGTWYGIIETIIKKSVHRVEIGVNFKLHQFLTNIFTHNYELIMNYRKRRANFKRLTKQWQN